MQTGIFIYWAFIYFGLINQLLAINVMTKITECQHYGALLGSSNDLAKIVEATSNAAVTLQCRYCEKSPKFGQKIKWFYKKRGSNVLAEELNTFNAGKKYIVADTLQLKSFDISDSGIYSCHLANSDEDAFSFTYVLDAVFKNYATYISGTYEQWKTYHKKYLAPINHQFITSGSPPFAYLRKSLSISFQIRTSWGDWGPCVRHNRNLTKSFRRKYGKCVLHPFPCYHSQEINVMQSSKRLYLFNYFINDNFDVSCHSIQLRSLLPEISKIVKMIPDYENIEECRGTKHFKTNRSKSKGFKYVGCKYNATKKVIENSHFTLTCPETSLQSDVKWYKNGYYLNSSFRNNMAQQEEEEPHLTIDSINTLYILHATKKEEGVYACVVNNKRIQIFIIQVLTKSTLLNDEFIRYSIYLGLVLSLTMTCYCAGMCIAWHRRNSFIDPHHRSFRKRNQDPAHQE